MLTPTAEPRGSGSGLYSAPVAVKLKMSGLGAWLSFRREKVPGTASMAPLLGASSGRASAVAGPLNPAILDAHPIRKAKPWIIDSEAGRERPAYERREAAENPQGRGRPYFSSRKS